MSKTEGKVYELKAIDDDNDWTEVDCDEFMYYTISTHELRSTISSEILNPVSRFDDREMHLSGYRGYTK